MSAPPLLVQREGPVVHLTLNRPERRNAIGGGMGEAMDAALAALATDRAARAVVLRGAGGHFCAGLDLAELGADPGAGEARNRAIAARFQAIAALPQVVVAVVEGACHAGGLGFLCAADIALGSADARFAAPEVRRGLVPAQILPWLVHRMGRSRATRLVLEGRVLDAPAALAAGLLHEVQPDRAALDAALAEILAALREGAPGALAETKGLLAALGPVVPPGYAEAGVAAFARTAAGPEAAEGIAAFREKRRPAWSA